MLSYQNLLTYQQCEEIYDLTVEFCQKYLAGRELLRQREQMIQAARSAKQCLAEGASQKTSLKGYIKMLGVSRGSLEELLLDYRDFARLRNIPIWSKYDPRLKEMGKKVKTVKKITGKFRFPSFHFPSSPSLPSLPSSSVNYMVDLVTRTNYLLDRQRQSLEEKFVAEGGYTETLFRKRLTYRKNSE